MEAKLTILLLFTASFIKECISDSCTDSFIKVIDKSEYAVSDCAGDGFFYGTLDGCKAEACAKNANTFNYKNSFCYYKNCENGELKLAVGTAYGGYDVYSTPENDPRSCSQGFTKVIDKLEDIITECPHIGGFYGYGGLESCMITACANGANAINWKIGACYYKKCEEPGQLQLLKSSHHRGYDVYALEPADLESCATRFVKVHDQSEDAISECTDLRGQDAKTLENCMRATCSYGGNTFNYKDGLCYYKKCENQDLKVGYATGHGGWNVYALDSVVEVETVLKFVTCRESSLAIQCPENQVIEIRSAVYGREDSTTCLDNDELETTCTSDAKTTLEGFCNGENSCNTRVNDRKFGKDCKDSAPYLVYEYVCA